MAVFAAEDRGGFSLFREAEQGDVGRIGKLGATRGNSGQGRVRGGARSTLSKQAKLPVRSGTNYCLELRVRIQNQVTHPETIPCERRLTTKFFALLVYTHTQAISCIL